MTVMVTGVDEIHGSQQHSQRTSGQRCSKPFSQVRMYLWVSCGQVAGILRASCDQDCMSMKMTAVSMNVKWM